MYVPVSTVSGYRSPRSIFDFFIQINDDTPIEFSYSVDLYNEPSAYDNWSIFTPSTDDVYVGVATYNDTVTLRKGDKIRIYLLRDQVATNDIAFWGKDGLHVNQNNDDVVAFSTERPIGMDEIPTYFRFTQQTIFPTTNAPSFFIHDVGASITDRIIGRNDTFYSENLGATYTNARQYDVDGCNAHYLNLKGLQIRQYSLFEKPFFQNFKQWWDGVNPIFNLGLGYENISNTEVIRVEPKSYFYDSSETSVNFGNVREIKRKYDNSQFYSVVEIGYKKGKAEATAGLSDPQVKRTYNTLLKRVGKKETITSEFIAASVPIEETRRALKEKSADYKFDDDTFIISINPTPVTVSPETSPDLVDYDPELDENFDSITNVDNSDTKYNLRLTCARNLLRWLNILSAGLFQYTSSFFRFSSGEGNYDMISDLSQVSPECNDEFGELSEKQDIQVSINPLFVGQLFEVSVPLTWEAYLTIRNNRTKSIGISQTASDFRSFFIKSLEYEPVKGRATMEVWPKNEFELVVPEPDNDIYAGDCFCTCEL